MKKLSIFSCMKNDLINRPFETNRFYGQRSLIHTHRDSREILVNSTLNTQVHICIQTYYVHIYMYIIVINIIFSSNLSSEQQTTGFLHFYLATIYLFIQLLTTHYEPHSENFPFFKISISHQHLMSNLSNSTKDNYSFMIIYFSEAP